MEFRYINVPRNTQRESPSENNRTAKYRCNEHIYEVSDVLLNTYSVSEIIFILTAGVDRVQKKRGTHIFELMKEQYPQSMLSMVEYDDTASQLLYLDGFIML